MRETPYFRYWNYSGMASWQAMQSQNRMFADLARMAGGAMGVASGMREEAEAAFRDQFERVLSRLDLVRREEFEAMRSVAVTAREEQERLAKRVDALERRIAELETPKRKPPRKTSKTGGNGSSG